MKGIKVLLSLVLILLIALSFAACQPAEGSETTYIVYFDINGGEGNDISYSTTGDTFVLMPAVPKREGYVFKGWYYDINLWQKPFKEDSLVSHPLTRNVTVYARWLAIGEDDPLDPDDGGENPTELPVYSVSYFTGIPNGLPMVGATVRGRLTVDNIYSPVRAGYDLEGWYYNDEFMGEPIVLPLNLTHDIAIYAKWKIKKYAITFDKNDPDATGIAPVMEDKANGENFILPVNTFTKIGYAFAGWRDGDKETDNVYSEGALYPMRKDNAVTFRALWEKTYTPGFSAGEGTGDFFTLAAVRTNTVVTLPANQFTKTDYAFGGWWCEDEDCPPGERLKMPGDRYNMPSKNVNFTALWIRTYYATFQPGDDAAGTAPYVAPVPAGQTIVLPQNTFTKQNHDFDGWVYNSVTYQPNAVVVMPAGGFVFTAKWKANTRYSVVFEGGDYAMGSGPEMAPQREGATFTLPQNTFIRNFYSFAGWDFNGTVYAAGEPFVMLRGSVNFSAVWTPINYSIKYVIKEGYGSAGNPTIYNVETPTFTLIDPVVPGYTFGGWYDDAYYIYPSLTTFTQGNAYDRTLYAKLTANNYKLYFDDTLGGASVSNISGEDGGGKYITVTYDKAYAALYNSVIVNREGYTLAFWSYNGADYTPSPIWTSTGNITLKAVWTLKATAGLRFTPNPDGFSYAVSGYTGASSSVVIPTYYDKKTVSAINRYAFYNSDITSIHIPETVVTINEYAFFGTKIAELTLPGSLVTLSSYAFAMSQNLVKVTFRGEGIISTVGERAFSGCPRLEYLRLPGSVINAGESLFAGSPNLTLFSSATGATSGWSSLWNSSRNNVVWGVSKYGDFYLAGVGGGLSVIEYDGDDTVVNVPVQLNGVTVSSLGKFSFKNNTSLKRIYARGVSKFSGAFDGCVNLEAVYTLTAIDLTASDFSDSPRASLYCQQSFAVDTAVPVFLNIAELYYQNGWYYVDYGSDYMLTGYTGLDSSVTVPSLIEGKNVAALGKGLFRNNGVITDVTVPAGIEMMKNGAFSEITVPIYCQTMKPMAWESGWNANNQVTYAYQQITSNSDYNYVIYGGRSYITSYKGSSAEVYVPDVLGGYPVAGLYHSFNNKPLLKRVMIPSGVTEMSGTFVNSSAVVIYAVASSAPQGWIDWNKNNQPVYFGIASLEVSADGFIYTTDINTGLIITGYAGEEISVALPTEINIGGTDTPVSGIGAKAFYANALQEIFIPSGYNFIRGNAFGGNSGLVIYYEGSRYETLTFDENWYGGAPFYCGQAVPNIADGYHYIEENGSAVITGYTGTDLAVTIPVLLNGLPVYEIGARAFLNSSVTSVTLPVTILAIGANAFLPAVNVSSEAALSPGWEFNSQNVVFGLNNVNYGDFTYVAANGLAYLTGYNGAASFVDLPASVNGNALAAIVGAFKSNSTLRGIRIPAGVQLLAGAFLNTENVYVLFESLLIPAHTANWLDQDTKTYYGASPVTIDTNGIIYTVFDEYAVVVGHESGVVELTVNAEIAGAEVFAVIGKAFDSPTLRSVILECNDARIETDAFGLHDMTVYLYRNLRAGENLRMFGNVRLIYGLNTANRSMLYTEGNLQYYIENDYAVITNHLGYDSDGIIALSSYPVREILSYAFYKANLTTVVIPGTVKVIGTKAFGDNHVDLICYYASAPAYGFAENWHSGNEVAYYPAVDEYGDYLYTVYDNKVYIQGYNGAGGDVVVPDTIDGYPVVDIGAAFAGNLSVTSLTLPATVMLLNDGLGGCYNLVSVNIPAAVKEIPDYLFKDFVRLETVTFDYGSENLKKIGDGAFYNCIALTVMELPESVSEIGAFAFYGCVRLEKFSAGYWYERVEESTFENCVSLNDFYVYYLVYIGDNAFKKCKKLPVAELYFAEYIGVSAYEGAASLTSLDLNPNLLSISANAFYGCTSLRRVVMSDDIESIGAGAFKNCSQLVSIEGGISNLLSVGDSAFENTSSLSIELQLPEAVQLGSRAFYCSGNLGNVYFGNSLISIGSEALSGSSIASIEVGQYNYVYKSDSGVLYNRAGAILIQYPTASSNTFFDVPSSVKSIAPSAFRNSVNLSSITVLENVVNINEYAFAGCNTLTVFTTFTSAPQGWNAQFNSSSRPVCWGYGTYSGSYDRLLYTVKNGEVTITGFDGRADFAVIPSVIDHLPVKAIASLALSYSGLKYVIIPSSVVSIGADAFLDEVATVIYCAAASKPQGFIDNWNRSYNKATDKTYMLPVYYGVSAVGEIFNIQYIIVNDTARITRYTGTQYYIDVPSQLGGSNVTAINAYAFYGSSLRAVRLPSTLVSVSKYAFAGASSIVIYLQGSSASAGFESGWNNLKPVYYGVSTVNLDGGFQYIVENSRATVTRYVGSQTEITVPSSLSGSPVLTIGKYAFAGTAVERVFIPDEVMTIDEYAFAFCYHLTEVDFEGNTLRTIGAYAFRDAISLTDFYIPSGVVQMGVWVFSGALNLSGVRYYDDYAPASWQTGWNYVSYNNGIYIYIQLKGKK